MGCFRRIFVERKRELQSAESAGKSDARPGADVRIASAADAVLWRDMLHKQSDAEKHQYPSQNPPAETSAA